ncbi:(2Fe-2S)-binding protein [Sulfodiicoccus acidiphilus]|uniref:(2Fe-2S)-binding protein n=1 Tax=Sulfodiicoccus acidiphilus TaxID=1670455 RepID=A0A348B113_9CREN|nr:Rieske (2Fe-2S) protein [Sulfodiicoccus acidiphilus]BBD71865.1 (2Fe-2S)-binding protein [Sulfodiicoccus acidiphilus]GGT91066.1 (2Fe-2S)-binding protein [Sulfodiicoccus acidiphilus]
MKIAVGKVSAFKIGERRKVDTPHGPIVVFFLGGKTFHAFSARCPHLGCDLSKYGVVIKEEIVCQCHFTHFSIKDGHAIKGATKKELKKFAVELENEEVKIVT